MSYWEIALLAVIQGAAELLPVSSSAHVILAAKLMGRDPSDPEFTFLLVMLHTGTMFAVLYYFWPRWKALLWPKAVSEGEGEGEGEPAPRPRWHFVLMVLLATAVTGIVGQGLILLIEEIVLVGMMGHAKGEVENLFKELPLVGTALVAAGLLIIAAGFRDSKDQTAPLATRSAIIIGLVQSLCVPFRGFSRSGATISTALFCGISRSLAEDFSFALAVALTPPAIARLVHRLLKAREWVDSTGLFNLLLPGMVGMVFSFIAGMVALKVLSAALERGHWKYFGYYCLAAAAAVFTAAYRGY
jgi:undecaprenyl-diphosphatase